jgi:RNA polymerase sigma-70 factor (ECF subfamily)
VRTGAATDAQTGVAMRATVRPAAGWVRVSATVTGVPAGEQCRLFVVAVQAETYAGQILVAVPI